MNASEIMVKTDYVVFLGFCKTTIYIKLSQSESQNLVMEASFLSEEDQWLCWISLLIKTQKYIFNKRTQFLVLPCRHIYLQNLILEQKIMPENYLVNQKTSDKNIWIMGIFPKWMN